MFIDQQTDDHITLRNPGHSNKTFTSLAQLRKDNILCDAVVIVEDKKYNVHRNVLASNSEYFKTMFTSQLTGINQKEFPIESITCEVFEEIIHYCYNGCFNLDMISVLDMIHAASLLLMKEIVFECFKYLRRNMDLSNCLKVQKIAEAYNEKDILKDSINFIQKNFEEISKGKEILNISFKNIQKLLSNNELLCKTEDTVVYLLKNWLTIHSDSSMQEVKLLIKCLKMPHVTKIGFNCLNSVMKDLDAKNAIDDFSKALHTEQKLQMRTNKRKSIDSRLSQKTENVIFCVNRRGESFCYDINSKRFRTLKRLPTEFLQPAQLTVHENIVYAVGAASAPSVLLQSTYSDRLSSYSPKDNQWKQLPSMRYPRARHAAVFLNDKLYVIGGKSSVPDNTGHSVECFDPVTSTWKHMTSTLSKRISSAVTASHKHVYAIGGEAPDDIINGLDTAERYCPVKNKWEKLPTLNHKRVSSSAVYFNYKIYVFGGGNGIFDLRNFEYLNPNEKQWTVVSIPYTTPITNTLVLNGRIVALGYSAWGDELALSNSFARRSGLSWKVIKDFIHPSHRVKSMKYTVINMLNYDIDKKTEGHCDCTSYDEDSESNMEYTSSDDDDDEDDFGGWLDPDPWGLWL